MAREKQRLKEKLLSLVPPQYRQHVVDIKNYVWGGYRHHHYSQFGEDIVIGQTLTGKRGFYIDVGAHHPRRYSNTYLLYKRGWRGINIEPNPKVSYAFKLQRPKDIHLQCGVGSVEGAMTYYMFSDPAFNTFSLKEAEALVSKTWLKKLGTLDVPICSLRTIIKTHAHGKEIGLLNIDVEGMDLDVLKSNDWNECKPRVICIEDSRYIPSAPEQSAVYTYLSEKQYSLIAYVGATLIFQLR